MGARLVLSLAMAMASPERLVAHLQLRGNWLVGGRELSCLGPDRRYGPPLEGEGLLLRASFLGQLSLMCGQLRYVGLFMTRRGETS